MTTVAPSAQATPSGTLVVAVSSGGACRGGREHCAIEAAMETVLFRGVPGSVQPLPLVADERAARDAHGAFITSLTSGDLARTYVIRANAGSDDRSSVVTLNIDRLRDALVREGVIRRFGY